MNNRVLIFGVALSVFGGVAMSQEGAGHTAIILPSGSYEVLSGQVQHDRDGVTLKGATIRIPLGHVVQLPGTLLDPAGENPRKSTAPIGPPMTAGERDALRVGVQRCWNVDDLSSEALATTVVVTVQMNEDATPNIGTIRMTGSSGGSDGSARQAFDTARRAIIRCGVSGFDLPPEKYGQWREIEMTFDPSNMRIK